MEIEWLILADSAQIVGAKLYILGGGWDRLTVNSSFPLQRHLAVATAIRVPWNETNQKHSFEVVITDQDATIELAKVNGQFEVGRPPGIPPGQDQRIQMAAEMSLNISKPGQYVIIARLDGRDEERYPFSVIAGPQLAARMTAPPEDGQ